MKLLIAVMGKGDVKEYQWWEVAEEDMPKFMENLELNGASVKCGNCSLENIKGKLPCPIRADKTYYDWKFPFCFVRKKEE